MIMKISTNELRFNFKKVMESLSRGIEMTLTYRNRPLARIVPLEQQDQVPDEDPFCELHEKAEVMGSLSNEEIDSILSDA